MNYFRVLYVDDDPLFLDSMKEALAFYGYDTITAPSRERGEYLIENGDFSAYIFDLDLNDEYEHSGLYLISMAADSTSAEDGAIIFLITGKGNEAIYEKARSLGADECLEKPTSARIIAEKLESRGLPGKQQF